MEQICALIAGVETSNEPIRLWFFAQNNRGTTQIPGTLLKMKEHEY